MSRKPRGYWQQPIADLAIVHDPSDANTTRGYISVTRQGKQRLLHDVIWEELVGPIAMGMVIDHDNRIKTDCRLSNLRCVTQKVNTRNGGMRSDNTSGITGVFLKKSKEFEYWAGTYKDPITGKQYEKAFSIAKLGAANAKQAAIEWRETKLKELIANHDYHPNHGK